MLEKADAQIICAKIEAFKDHDYETGNDNFEKIALLKLGNSDVEWEDFLKLLDFEYSNGYGGQELFGTVWLSDGSWLSRGEYDGSEWWNHNKLPEIPAELATTNNPK